MFIRIQFISSDLLQKKASHKHVYALIGEMCYLIVFRVTQYTALIFSNRCILIMTDLF